MFKRKIKPSVFRDTLLMFLRFHQIQFPTLKRAILIAKIERGVPVRVSAQQLRTEALNAGLPCEIDFKDAASKGVVFEIAANGVETVTKV